MKELKIIVGEKASSTHIYVDGEPVGFIQDIKIHVAVDASPTVEITFPDFRQHFQDNAAKVATQVQKVLDMPQVKVGFVKI